MNLFTDSFLLFRGSGGFPHATAMTESEMNAVLSVAATMADEPPVAKRTKRFEDDDIQFLPILFKGKFHAPAHPDPDCRVYCDRCDTDGDNPLLVSIRVDHNNHADLCLPCAQTMAEKFIVLPEEYSKECIPE